MVRVGFLSFLLGITLLVRKTDLASERSMSIFVRAMLCPQNKRPLHSLFTEYLGHLNKHKPPGGFITNYPEVAHGCPRSSSLTVSAIPDNFVPARGSCPGTPPLTRSDAEVKLARQPASTASAAASQTSAISPGLHCSRDPHLLELNTS